ncbi:MAG: hypothetical protein U9Q30_10000 [Campylobacterota bacterium]|nr:hypothetical protein [Campylobacterota bacterium]
MCSIEIFQNTVERIKDNFQEILNNKMDDQESNNKVIIINGTQIWTLKLFNVFFIIAIYLKKKGYIVKILLDDGMLEHIDMIKKDELFSIEEAKKRNIYTINEFKKLETDIFVYYSDLINQEDINIDKYDESLIKTFEESVYVQYALVRYDNDINNKEYKKTLIQNMVIGHELAKSIDKKYKPLSIISCLHMTRYSLASFSKYFENRDVNRLDIGIPKGGYKDEKALQIFSKDEKRDSMYKILENLHMDNEKIEIVDKLMQNRMSYNHHSNIDKIDQILQVQQELNKKIVVVFPNMFEDAMWSGYHTIFNSVVEWFIETITFLKNNDFFIIVKAHPSEKKWGSKVTSLEYIKDIVDENFLLIENDANIPAYSLYKYIDLAVVYNSTLFMETIYSDIPVIVGGNSYIINGIFKDTTVSKGEYFKLFKNIHILKDKQLSKKELLYKYIYFDFFCREIYFKCFNTNIVYPQIDNKIVLEMLEYEDNSLNFIEDLISGVDLFEFNKYRKIFEFDSLV